MHFLHNLLYFLLIIISSWNNMYPSDNSGGVILVKRIQVSTFLKKLGEGSSEPLLVIGDDNERYILKNQKVIDQGKPCEYDTMFLNEFLSGQIAKHLGVPTPEFAIAELDRRILENGPTLRFVHRFTEGVHFASKELPDVESNYEENMALLVQMKKPHIIRAWNKYFEDIINPQDVAKIIAFDLYIANFDRYNNVGNLLVHQSAEGRRITTIDHGHAFFGPIWDTNKASFLKSPGTEATNVYFNDFLTKYLMWSPYKGFMGGLGEVFRSIERNIELETITEHSFKSVVCDIESISEEVIDSWFAEIPNSWYKDKNTQIGFYKHFLMHQKFLVRHLIQSMANCGAFSNFRGGSLEWIEKHAGTV